MGKSLNSFVILFGIIILMLGMVVSKTVHHDKELELSFVPDAEIDPEYQKFFDSLTQEEKIGLMTLAVYFHDSDFVINPIAPPNIIKENARNIGIQNNGSEININIPKSIYSYLLNGNIPKYWQKEFTKWLKKEYNFNYENFELYKRTNSFCLLGEACPRIENIGGSCCPFG